jgi:ribosomal protein S12 methylthiotransferase
MVSQSPATPGPAGRAFYLHQMGCAKNLVEGEHLAGMLMAAGWRPAASPAEAEALIVNTCGFIRPAVEESLDAVLELAAGRRPGQRLAVVGCLVGRYGKKLAASLEEADLLVSPGALGRLPELLAAAEPPRLAMAAPAGVFGASHPRALATGPGWAYLRLADGCAHRCGFCTIPAIRGKLRSRPPEDVLAEARELAAGGVVELNLVAQDLTSYGQDLGCSLAELLPELAAVSGVSWVRMLYLHPDFLGEELIRVVAETPGVLPYWDLPLQHAADAVLAAMGRRRGGAELAGLVARLRETDPEAALRATVMTGHPGEGEAEFARLGEFVAAARLDHLGCFAYEPEPGTRAARLAAPPAETALARAQEIMELQRGVSRRRLARLVGERRECLVLGPHPDSELVWRGRLACQAPEVDGEVIITEGAAEPGSIAAVEITGSHDYDLEGRIAG